MTTLTQMQGKRGLFSRRKRFVWPYVFLGVTYLATAYLYFVDREISSVLAIGILLIPLILVVVQLVYPTLLGWLILMIPTFWYTGLGIYYLTIAVLNGKWEYDSSGLITGFIAVCLYCSVTAGLIMSRPTLLQGIDGRSD